MKVDYSQGSFNFGGIRPSLHTLAPHFQYGELTLQYVPRRLARARLNFSIGARSIVDKLIKWWLNRRYAVGIKNIVFHIFIYVT